MFSAIPNKPIELAPSASAVNVSHIFLQEDIDAIDAALTAKRPLLVRGEPGVGKSQLARAAAQVMNGAFCQMVVDSRTEARDLKWREDLVARLADAQLIGSLPEKTQAEKERSKLDLRNYVTPGPLWWAFDWNSATRQATRTNEPVPAPLGDDCTPENGVVVLIDEIDKAEAELPNGLLEALGAREFTPTGHSDPVKASAWPLVVITTNEERQLPDAFIRRCVVHDMRLPTNAEDLKDHLTQRGRAHFPAVDDDVLETAANQTIEDRKACERQRLRPLPGQAEYLDLLRAVSSPGAKGGENPMERLTRLSRYFLRKHPELRG